jgi:predicted nucleic acid-binding protein
MRRPSLTSSTIPLYVMGALFLVPLTIGVFMVSSNADQGGRANEISRDLASMYAQGMDFSRSENRDIAMRVAERLGMRGGEGVVILSKIRVVNDSDCRAAASCANNGRAVVTQRYFLGNASLRESSFGSAANLDRAGNVANWANDVSARAKSFSAPLKPGEVIYAAECFLMSQDSAGGVYSRVMY